MYAQVHRIHSCTEGLSFFFMLPPKELAYVGRQLKKLKLRYLEEYYTTQQWEIVKRAKRDSPRIVCELCDCVESKDCTMNLHHKTYKRLGEEMGYDLMWLCEECHETFHLTVNRLLGDGEHVFSYVLDCMLLEKFSLSTNGN